MSTEIFYNDNRIIIDGHADTTEECQAITALCDSMANDKNFKTIVYENGHAVFERIDGGDSLMFESLQTQFNELSAYVKTLKSCKCDHEKALADYSTQNEASKTYATLATINTLIERIVALENKTEYTLPYTANELVEKLGAL